MARRNPRVLHDHYKGFAAAGALDRTSIRDRAPTRCDKEVRVGRGDRTRLFVWRIIRIHRPPWRQPMPGPARRNHALFKIRRQRPSHRQALHVVADLAVCQHPDVQSPAHKIEACRYFMGASFPMLRCIDFLPASLPPPSASRTPPPQAEEEISHACREVILPPFTGQVPRRGDGGVRAFNML